MKDIMIDIETMGSGGYTALVQLAAVQFDRYTGELGHEFFANVDLQSCLDLGLKLNAETVYWWLTREPEAIKSITAQPRRPLQDVIHSFKSYLDLCCFGKEFGTMDLHLWGRSPRFDIAIIYDAFQATGNKRNWDIRKEMCVRTIESKEPWIKSTFDKLNEGRVQHDGLADCKHQISYVVEHYKCEKKKERLLELFVELVAPGNEYQEHYTEYENLKNWYNDCYKRMVVE